MDDEGMSGIEAIKAAHGAGVSIAVEGNNLRLEAPVAPPPQIIDLLARYKAEVVALLGRSTQGLSSSQPRSEISENAIVEWLNQNPEPSVAGSCAWCGKRETAFAVVLPFGVGPHAWLHTECWPAWHRARRERAMAALRRSEAHA